MSEPKEVTIENMAALLADLKKLTGETKALVWVQGWRGGFDIYEVPQGDALEFLGQQAVKYAKEKP